jgi:hypothetical protein
MARPQCDTPLVTFEQWDEGEPALMLGLGFMSEASLSGHIKPLKKHRVELRDPDYLV